MQVRDRQHKRIVLLVGLIIAISSISLGRELAGLMDGGLLNGLISAGIIAMIATVSIMFWRSSQDTKSYTELVYYDELTGLPNKRHFDQRLSQELDRCKRHGGLMATMYFDLDQFKAINDCYGHSAGDAAIQQFGERIKEEVRNEDVVARLSGDEFAALVTELRTPSDIVILAERIIAAMRKPIHYNGKTIYVGVSIGGAIIEDGTIDAAEAMRQADFALLQAKNNGRNQLQLFDPEMAETINAKKRMESDLREAIDNDRLHLAYQPQVSQDGQNILGVEALVRWDHPKTGPISPVTFIPIAEETGLIDTLGEMILRRACLDIGELEGTKLAVNVSPVQFRQESFVDVVRDILVETGFPSHLLELEISEGIFISNPEKATKTIKKLRELGVRIALDDFGTGYATLAYLREFKLDRIKIDRSFVKDMECSTDAQRLVATMIELGSGLGLSVTVEGVETAEQRDLLFDSGCDALQGFLFSKPVPMEELRHLNLDTDGSMPVSTRKMALAS
ncbi:MAG: EAL domain-containing protein [Alphaproteobacteria bacterium]|nr:EAL domain-containing protein [Alphaproteobacteria bacterium]